MSEPEEPGCHERFSGGIRQLVPGQLFDDEPIDRFVAVERIDHVVPVAPDERFGRVPFVTVAFGIPGDIQPMTAPAFAVGGPTQEFLDDMIELRIRRFEKERRLFLLGGWKTCQVEMHSAQDGWPRRVSPHVPAVLLEFRQNKLINGISGPPAIRGWGRGWCGDRLEGPVQGFIGLPGFEQDHRGQQASGSHEGLSQPDAIRFRDVVHLLQTGVGFPFFYPNRCFRSSAAGKLVWGGGGGGVY